jgi:hypothetical protein
MGVPVAYAPTRTSTNLVAVGTHHTWSAPTRMMQA